MKLSTKSWHSWLFRYTYGKDNLPDNLCPYFWKLVLAMILFPVLFIFCLPAFILCRSTGDNDLFEEGVFSPALAFSFVINLALVLIIGMIGMWFDFNNEFLVAAGGCGWLIAICAGIDQLVRYIKSKRVKTYGTMYREEKPSILIEFIKAKYNKYCPKITWKD